MLSCKDNATNPSHSRQSSQVTNGGENQGGANLDSMSDRGQAGELD